MAFSLNSGMEIEYLPNEVLFEITKSLNLRLVNSTWNEVASAQLRHCPCLTLTFNKLKRLQDFLEIFEHSLILNYKSLCGFWVKLKLGLMMCSESMDYIKILLTKYGESVINLRLDFASQGRASPSTAEYVAITKNMKFVMKGVKSRIKKLKIDNYSGLDPVILGIEMFPLLQKIDLSYGMRNLAPIFATGFQIKKENFLLQLATMVPAIQEIHLKFPLMLLMTDQRLVLKLMKNFSGINPNVNCKLLILNTLMSRFFEHEWMADNTPIYDLSVSFLCNVHCQGFLNWIGQKSSSLRKLTFIERSASQAFSCKFPNLLKLQELIFISTPNSESTGILPFISANTLPEVRKATIKFACKHSTGPMPAVTELHLDPHENFETIDTHLCTQLILTTFPYIQYLSCEERLLTCNLVFEFICLKSLHLTLDSPSQFLDDFNRWSFYVPSSHQLALKQILELPEDCCGTEGPILLETKNFKDMRNLENLSVSFSKLDGRIALDAILFLSKTKNLNRLKTLFIRLEQQVEIPFIYEQELSNYHEHVQVIQDQPFSIK